jgi:hypothetical protein
MARQPAREDLFTPIHKGIRSMIYDLGTKLQKTDFTDVAATNAILTQLKHNLQSANSTCIVCMLHEHGGHEDQSIFPQLAPFDSKAVDAMIQEHVDHTTDGRNFNSCRRTFATKGKRSETRKG